MKDILDLLKSNPEILLGALLLGVVLYALRRNKVSNKETKSLLETFGNLIFRKKE